MMPEQFAEKIAKLPGVRARCVALYGSAAAGDHIAKQSDYNILVVLEKLDADVLDALAPLAALWTRAGNPPPMLFTEEQLRDSTDVFPIELADIREHHKVLAGEDVLANLTIDKKDLRLQLERELRTRQIALRERYLSSAGRPQEILDLMLNSLSTFLVLFRAALRLFQEEVPARKLDALAALARHTGCAEADIAVFRKLQDIRSGSVKAARGEAPALFRQYLKGIESLIEIVNKHLPSNPEG